MKLNLILLLLVFFSSVSIASADEFLSNPSNELIRGVQSLYNSAQKLSVGNSVLAVRLNEMSMKLNALQLRFKQVALENNRLSDEALKLQENDPAMARRIADLEKAVFEKDAGIEDLKNKIKEDADAIALGPVQQARLDVRLNELGLVLTPEPVDPNPNAKEKLQILKMIDASKQKQQTLNMKITTGQVASHVRVISPEQEQRLLAGIAQVKTDIDQINKMSVGKEAGDVNLAEFKQIQTQVNLLQKNKICIVVF